MAILRVSVECGEHVCDGSVSEESAVLWRGEVSEILSLGLAK